MIFNAFNYHVIFTRHSTLHFISNKIYAIQFIRPEFLRSPQIETINNYDKVKCNDTTTATTKTKNKLFIVYFVGIFIVRYIYVCNVQLLQFIARNLSIFIAKYHICTLDDMFMCKADGRHLRQISRMPDIRMRKPFHCFIQCHTSYIHSHTHTRAGTNFYSLLRGA